MLYSAACCYARMGENKLAIDALKSSIIAGLEDYELIKRDPDFEGLRNDYDYVELMRVNKNYRAFHFSHQNYGNSAVGPDLLPGFFVNFA